jgi:hypothetical protein
VSTPTPEKPVRTADTSSGKPTYPSPITPTVTERESSLRRRPKRQSEPGGRRVVGIV